VRVATFPSIIFRLMEEGGGGGDNPPSCTLRCTVLSMLEGMLLGRSNHSTVKHFLPRLNTRITFSLRCAEIRGGCRKCLLPPALELQL